MQTTNSTTDSSSQAGTEASPKPEDLGMGPSLPTLAELKTLPDSALRERLEAIPADLRAAFVVDVLKQIQTDQDAACQKFFQEKVGPAIEEATHKALEEIPSTRIGQEAGAIGDLIQRVAPTVEGVLLKLGEQGSRAVGELVDRAAPTLLKINDKNNSVDRPSLDYLDGVLALARKYNADLTVDEVEVCLQEGPPPRPAPRSRPRKTK